MGLALAGVLTRAAPASARDSLGTFGTWGAFRDSAGPRCYALAPAAQGRRVSDHQAATWQAFADVTVWPRRGVPEVHFRLSRDVAPDLPIILAIGGQNIALAGSSSDARIANSAINAAVLAAMRTDPGMAISAYDTSRRRFVDKWHLAGAAPAIDTAANGCAKPR